MSAQTEAITIQCPDCGQQGGPFRAQWLADEWLRDHRRYCSKQR